MLFRSTGDNKNIENYLENNRLLFVYYPKSKKLEVDKVILWAELKNIFNLSDYQIQKTIINWVQEKFGIGEIEKVEPGPVWAYQEQWGY